MRGTRQDATQPFAPLPASTRKTNLALGSWFQGHPRLIQVISVIALLVGLAYFTFRLVVTSEGVSPFAFWPLFIAELVGFLSVLMMVVEAWRIDSTPRPAPLDITVDVVIATYDEDLDILEPTVIGATKIRGKTTIYLSDDSDRPEMRELAERYGLHYQTREGNLHAKAGNINAILPRLTSQLLLVLDADHVPSPDFLEAMTGYFSDPTIALAQSAHSFRNHNSAMHDEEGRHEQSLFFDVLLPGRNRLDSAFWCGSAGLIRIEALRSIGGMGTRTVTEDFETTLELQRNGYRTLYHNEHLIQGLAPDSLSAYLVQRFRWARGNLSVLRPLQWPPWGRGLSWKQKFSYTGALLHYLSPLQRLTYMGNLLLVGAAGIIPMTYAGAPHLVLWGLWIGLSILAVTALERGSSQPFEGTRNQFLSMGAFLRAMPALVTRKSFPFEVTPKNQTDMGGYRSLSLVWLPLTLGLITFVVVALRWLDWVLGADFSVPFVPQIPIEVILVITIFALVELVILAQIAVNLVSRRQERALWRFPVQLGVEVDGHRAFCFDLHQNGMGLQVPTGIVGYHATVPVALDIWKAPGDPFVARGRLEVRNRRTIKGRPGVERIGGVVTWDSPHIRAAVIEYCYVDEPYRARNREWARLSPRGRVQLEGALEDIPVSVIDLSLGGAGVLSASAGFLAGERYTLRVIRDGAEPIIAAFTVRNVTHVEDGLWRIGGEAEWPEVGWLNSLVPLYFGPANAREAFPAFSPLL